jgi:hypothetical protein
MELGMSVTMAGKLMIELAAQAFTDATVNPPFSFQMLLAEGRDSSPRGLWTSAGRRTLTGSPSQGIVKPVS